jgi:hypothetical protein
MGPVRQPSGSAAPLRAGAAPLMMGWLTLVLVLDRSGTRATQALLGAATWLVLAVALRRCAPLVRVQTLVVVAFATVVEYTFSPGLDVYVYRFHNVPAFVPPGHGLVYLSAFALGHHSAVRRRLRAACVAVLVPLGLWAAYGLFLADRSDALGAVWFACLVGFVVWGPSREVYVGAAVVVTWLELAGTRLGTWQWQPEDPVGWLSIGNPPTGAAGGYGWFDLVALVLAPVLLRAWSGVRARSLRGRAAAAAAPAAPVVPGVPGVPDAVGR